MRYGWPSGTLAVSGLNLTTGLHIPQSGTVIVANREMTKDYGLSPPLHNEQLRCVLACLIQSA